MTMSNPQSPPLKAQASAPGKLILFGEHSVVYGEPAIAASLNDLRIHVSVSTRDDGVLDIQLPDLPIPLHLSTKAKGMRFSVSNSELDSPPTLKDAEGIHSMLLASCVEEDSQLSEAHITAVTPLIYLANKLLPSQLNDEIGISILCVSRNLPVGAGLGSSAAFGVSSAAALYQLHLRLLNHDSRGGSCQFWKGRPSQIQLERINELAFQSEVLIHGTPSEIDNTVSTYGSAIHFTKVQGGKTLNECIDANTMPALHVILTNTQVPRSTKALVAHVRKFKEEFPEFVEGILKAMGGIARCVSIGFSFRSLYFIS